MLAVSQKRVLLKSTGDWSTAELDSFLTNKLHSSSSDMYIQNIVPLFQAEKNSRTKNLRPVPYLGAEGPKAKIFFPII